MRIITAQTPATAHVAVWLRSLSLFPRLASPAMEIHTHTHALALVTDSAEILGYGSTFSSLLELCSFSIRMGKRVLKNINSF